MERIESEEELTGLETIMENFGMEIDPPFKENLATAEDWKSTLNKVVPAVVVLRITACRAFDTESSGALSATGFVVDKLRGIILTNRQVVGPGPVVAEAMFLNRVEVPVYPVYRDPVHDFGFFRYDPSAVQYLNYEEIPLAPEAAYVGLEIRVVGNDSGEKVSILAGTLARLDRDAPQYKKYGYNDFNIFYLQAASGTKGGSSGSPVIDWQGRAVALNAGSGRKKSITSFFLPLEQVVRALKFLQKGQSSSNNWQAVRIPRGTLQATFIHKGYDEIRRLGLRSETEQLVRHASPPGETGMLVVDSVVPKGPAHKHFEPGDVLVRVNGEVTTQFLKMENLIDDNVSHKVEFQIQRSGEPLTVNLMIQDLHSITPDYFLEISGAVIHPLSYQQARNFHFPCGLVYVAEQGYMLYRAGVPRHAIIMKFAGEDISRLEDLISVLSKLSRGAIVPLAYISYKDPHRRKSVLVTVDRHEWYAPPQLYTRDDSSGLWTRKFVLPPQPPLLSTGLVNSFQQDFGSNIVSSCSAEVTPMEHEHQCVGQKPMRSVTSMEATCAEVAEGLHYTPANDSVAEHVLESALVRFEVHMPSSCMLDGVHSHHFSGTGVIIYHSQFIGLIVVDRNTVVVSASDVMLSFAAYPIEVPGEVVFLHPVHNFAVVSYNPSALGAGSYVVRAAELLLEPVLCRGDSVYLVGLSGLRATSRKSIITNPCATYHVVLAHAPRYRATNMEVIDLDTDFGSTFTGVLADELGRVRAIWASFSTQIKLKSGSSVPHRFVKGIPIYTIRHILDKIISGAASPSCLINGTQWNMPLVRILEVELHPTLLSRARSFGLSDTWIQILMKKDPIRRHVLKVTRCLAGSQAEKLLKQGDMVLAINEVPVTCFHDIEDVCQELDWHKDRNGKLRLTIFRQGNEMELVVGTDVRDGSGTTRVINWCGCIVQDPHPAVRALGFLPEEGHGVYVARWYRGSPANRYVLHTEQWIVEINGKPTPDLDAFGAVTKEVEDGEFVRVKTIQLNGKPRVLTLKQDLFYWPTWELRFDPATGVWRRTTIKSL